MEFITVEQFKEQTKEVQEVFLDWWKPSIGDIYCNEYLVSFDGDKVQRLEVITNMTDTRNVKDESEFLCVLLTEGQLRKFIEDKISGKVESCYVWDYYTIAIRNTECGGDDSQHDTGETNLLKAYWKVACIIANEGVSR